MNIFDREHDYDDPYPNFVPYWTARAAYDDWVNGCAHEKPGDHGRGSLQILLGFTWMHFPEPFPEQAVKLGASLTLGTYHLPETWEKGTLL